MEKFISVMMGIIVLLIALLLITASVKKLNDTYWKYKAGQETEAFMIDNSVAEKKGLIMEIESDSLTDQKRLAIQVLRCQAKCYDEGLGYNDADGEYCFCNQAIRSFIMPKLRFVHQGEGVSSDEIGGSP